MEESFVSSRNLPPGKSRTQGFDLALEADCPGSTMAPLLTNPMSLGKLLKLGLSLSSNDGCDVAMIMQ